MTKTNTITINTNMKNILFPLILLLYANAGFSQTFPKEKTANHILIDGTNISMIPPALFEVTQNFKGFQNPNDPTSMIMTMEIPGPYSEVTKGFNTEMLKTRGMDLKTKKEFKLFGFDGTWIELTQPANGMIFSKHILVYGNSTSSTLINGVYIKDSVALGKQIKESLLTTFIDTKLNADPRKALGYTIDETVGGLKFHSVIGNGMLFNRDLKTPTESEDKATLIVDQSFAKMEIKDKKEFCYTRLEKYPDGYAIEDENTVKAMTIDGLSGYAMVAESTLNQNDAAYQVILFEETGGYFLFMGTYVKDQPTALADIKKVIATFERKK